MLFRRPLLVACLLLGACPKPGAAPEAATSLLGGYDLSAPLPIDDHVRQGVLDNGLRYYIETNDEPDDRAVLRLVVDAGSILEDDDQLGLAHVLEHMAFNGTEHFPHNELVSYLESVGTRFGAHLNAHTSFDETVYKLQVPTDDPELFDRSFVVLGDWAAGMTLDPEEIDKERGVVIEEWRTRLGVGERIGQITRPLVFAGSPYHERLPIGTDESLRTFTPEALRRYYTDWYRPDLMAVIAVGDFDPDAVEARIRATFGPLKNPEPPRERVRPGIPDHQEPLYAVVTDPEVTFTNVSVLCRHDAHEDLTIGDYRNTLVEGVALAVLNLRFQKLSREPGSPLLGAGVGPQRLSPTEGGMSLGLSAREGQALDAYGLALAEVERFRRYGATPSELESARALVLRGYDALAAEKDNTPSVTHAEELIRVYTRGEAMPGTDNEVAYARAFVPTIAADEVQVWASDLLVGSQVITVVQPEKDGLIPPTVDDLKAVEARVAALELPRPQDEGEVPDPIAAPTPGRVVERDTRWSDSLGVTGWTLSNGVQVWFKDTDFKDDEVSFSGFSPGGWGQTPQEDYVPAVTAISLLNRSGAGELDVDGLVRWGASRKASAYTGLGQYEETAGGSASPGNLGDALQLLHARIVAPRFDAKAFDLEKQNREEGLRNRLSTPGAHFADAWNATLWPDDPLAAPWTVETLERMDLERSAAIYKERFADVGDMKFAFVGNLPDDFEQLVTTWLATLPAGERDETWKDRGVRMAPGAHTVVVEKGQEQRTQVRMLWHDVFPAPSFVTRNRFYALADVLRVRLREALREEMGGVYGVGVSADVDWRPDDRYSLQVSFTCDPERADDLQAEVLRVVDDMKAKPVEPTYVTQVQEKNRRSREESLESNGFWLGVILNALRDGDDPVDAVDGYAARVASLTAADIQAAAKQYFTTKNRVVGRLEPEGP